MMDALTTALKPKDPPSRVTLTGRFVFLEPLAAERHGADFDAHLCGAANEDLWNFIPFGAPSDSAELFGVLANMQAQSGWISFAVRDLSSGKATGTVSLMRVRPEHGSAEIGCVVFGKALQRTPAASEAVFLLGQYLFDTLGYRRYEWKCDNRNEASRRAAVRFGFSFEGIFRNDMIVNGRNRDTAWFAMTDADWLKVRLAYDAWLSPQNFDEHGQQRESLTTLVSGAIG
ncbi:MAG: GNAT family protein [Pseudomonadota bacterium]